MYKHAKGKKSTPTTSNYDFVKIISNLQHLETIHKASIHCAWLKLCEIKIKMLYTTIKGHTPK